MKQALFLLAGSLLAYGQPAADVTKITRGIEQRYNNIKSLKVNFTETLVDRGGRHVPMSGVLYLEKPRKMRWDYASADGRFFLSDGEYDYDYIPKSHEVERSKLKDADDQRGPIAFLLGKVDFARDFGSYTTGAPDGSITAKPKSDKLPFSEISFIAGPDYTLKKLTVRLQEGATTTFVFENEAVNPALPASLFKFVLPAGADLTDAKQQ